MAASSSPAKQLLAAGVSRPRRLRGERVVARDKALRRALDQGAPDPLALCGDAPNDPAIRELGVPLRNVAPTAR